MNDFSELLKRIGQELGCKNTQELYNYIINKGELGCNYSYFSRIEAGRTVPSIKIINNLAKILGDEYSDRIILSFCATIFTGHDYLFTTYKEKEEEQKRESTKAPSIDKKSKKNEMSVHQVSTVSRTIHHYLTSLVLNLSRKSLSLQEIKQVKKLDKDNLQDILDDLIEVGLIFEEDGKYNSVHVELQWPSPYNEELEKIYKQLDLWDLKVTENLNLKAVTKTSMFRRVSPRYVGIIQTQLELTMSLLRCSEEFDKKHNNDAVMLQIDFSKGKLPG